MNINRNEACPCQSGKKYKQCCMDTGAALVESKQPAVLLREAQNFYQSKNALQADKLCCALVIQHPGYAEGWHLRGILASQKEDWEQALKWFDKAIALMPVPTVAMLANKAAALQSLGRLAEAIECYQQALQQKPKVVEIWQELIKLRRLVDTQAGVLACYQQAVSYNPASSQLWLELAHFQCEIGHFKDAHASYEHVLTLNVGKAGKALIYSCMAEVALQQKRYEKAVAYCHQALALEPSTVNAYNALGNSMKQMGRQSEAYDYYSRAIELSPAHAALYSNRLLVMQYMEQLSPKTVFDAHLEYAARFEKPLKSSWPLHRRKAHTHPRLKVGYVSADLYKHSVANFFEPVLAHHDKAKFEIYCYYNNNKRDATTNRLIEYADHWVWCQLLSDEQLVKRILQDEIDILVDLAGHTGYNNLSVFAHKPAPVQVTWMGYPGTTGLSAMDYRLTDAALDPVGLTDAYHTEKLVRLSCVAPFLPTDTSPPINELPALSSDKLTLAALQNPAKITAAVIALWARILDALPQARLLLGDVHSDLVREKYISGFASHGIGEERLGFVPRVSMQQYLELHHKADIMLDPFPYGGGTTTNHALWMGVPVVTLAGESTAARHGVYNLTAVGLTELITHSPEEYVARVVELASDLPRLNEMRLSMRERILATSVQPASLVREVEAAYFRMYDTWLSAQP